MANYRQVHTKIWKDSWFLSLPPDDKLLFIYLFSNEQASIAGIYELPVMVIAFETGLDIEYVTDALQRFEDANKVKYQDGIVHLPTIGRYCRFPDRCSRPEWKTTRVFILERDDHTCRYCGMPANHVDHIVPVVQGGGDAEENLVAACRSCNLHKSGRTPQQAGMELKSS